MRRFTNFVAAGFITLIIFSCGTSPRSTEARNPETAVAEVASAAVSNIEEELFNVIQDWVKSQNQGDFEKYKSFYAASFSGVKRAGANEYKYDVKGWLKDRERMFQKEMNVEARYLLINYHQAPYRVNFQQLWQSGSFSDYGPKLVKIDSVDGKLKIVSEEMLTSRVMATSNDTYDALAHRNFYIREGTNIFLNQSFEPADIIKTTKKCADFSSEYGLCVKIHQHAINQADLPDTLLSLLDRKVMLGNISSDRLSNGFTDEFRTVREELVDSLPGIFLPAGIFDIRYDWRGGDSKFTDFRSSLHLSAEGESDIERGQWAYVSDTEPIIFTKQEIRDIDLKAKYSSMLDSIDQSDLLLFTANGLKFLVSSHYESACGEVSYHNVRLWNVTREDAPLFVTNLPDLPAMILDLDKDDDLDILYEGQFFNDPSSYIRWEMPYYGLQGQDTVFLSCGC
ncbi:hypothetical protein RT717_14560 [Imperialibacter roseus]|uniref:Cds6 C-terminal domain-containing protein n=1 Tax=Imperialibacter roseus TaxID=1324217 RepID=A0ABZ0IIH1_9BACT|nr:hypothetical protein [Imperialibacter roseus]WOK04299.1 hypothetical protein RT717_14560 [Imperialibacter roseus]